jgi:hypothetical protein
MLVRPYSHDLLSFYRNIVCKNVSCELGLIIQTGWCLWVVKKSLAEMGPTPLGPYVWALQAIQCITICLFQFSQKLFNRNIFIKNSNHDMICTCITAVNHSFCVHFNRNIVA